MASKHVEGVSAHLLWTWDSFILVGDSSLESGPVQFHLCLNSFTRSTCWSLKLLSEAESRPTVPNISTSMPCGWSIYLAEDI